MEQFIEFAGNHATLFAALAVIAGLLVWTTMQTSGSARLAPVDVTRMMNQEDAVVLDVRSDAEFGEGHIVGSVHIPVTQIESSLTRLQKYREKPVIVACRTGQRSAQAARSLRKAGFAKVFNLTGGILAWQGANLPLTRK